MTDVVHDIIDRLARIEEGVAGVYPRLASLETSVADLKAFKLRIIGAGTLAGSIVSAGIALIGHDKLIAILKSLI